MIKSITQLTKEGYSETMLRQIAHMAGSPFFRSSSNGKFWCDEDALKKFIKEKLK